MLLDCILFLAFCRWRCSAASFSWLFAAGAARLHLFPDFLPLVLLGAFGYHLLFEAKSQYACTYIPLLVPTAAYAMNKVLFSDYTKAKKLVATVNKKIGKSNG